MEIVKRILLESRYIISLNKIDLLDINLSSSKISITFNTRLSNNILEQLHNSIINIQ